MDISLRKKRSAQVVRPKISAPQQILSNVPANFKDRPSRPQDDRNVVGSRDGLQGRNNAEPVKRRYSTRTTQAPRDANVPSVPGIPGRYQTSSPLRNARFGNSSNGEKIPIDLSTLQKSNLETDQCESLLTVQLTPCQHDLDVTQLLANASEQDIKEYQAELGTIRNQTSTDLQANVYQNRNQFIKISQEAEKLKSEMRALRSLMSELTTTLDQTSNALGIKSESTTVARKFANRSSVANLEAMWTIHLQELWRRVEGSQKFLPATPGRHVVHESGRWVELNPATWKPRRRVYLILLNDHLLVACEKKHVNTAKDIENLRKQMSTTPWQLTADRCLPLQDLKVVDLSSKSAGRTGSRPSNLNAIGLRYGAESLAFTTSDDDGSEKRTLLARYRKAAADLQKSIHSDADLVPTSRRSSAVEIIRSSVQNVVDPKVSALGKPVMPVEVDGKQHPFRWVEQQVDELDIDLALQRFGDAVSRVHHLRHVAETNKHNSALHDIVTGKVQRRAARLAEALSLQLANKHASIALTYQHVLWLTKLGFEAIASGAYLQARSQVVRTRVRYALASCDAMCS